jgi:O-antigen/teichoic acid export membrane protein
MVLAKKIAYNTIISAIARMLGLVIALVITSILTRYLGTEGFGYYTTILAFLYIFSVFADLGLYSICLREISKDGADEEKIINNILTIRLFVGLFVFFAAFIISLFFPYELQVKFGILIGGLGYWLMSGQQILMTLFQKYLAMTKVALAEVLGRLVNLLIILFILWQDLGFLWAIAAFVIGAWLNFFLVYFLSFRFVKIKPEFNYIFWKKILTSSLPLGLASVLTMIYFKFDTILLSVFKPAVDVGIYGLSYRVFESLLFFPAMFIGLIMPFLSKYALADSKYFKKISQKTLEIILIFIVLMVTGTLLLAPKVIGFLGGVGFAGSVIVLNILIFAAGIIFIAILFSNMIIALNQQKYLVYIYGAGALFNLVANLIFIPKYSYLGAATTTLMTEFFVTLAMVFVLKKTLKYYLSFVSIFRCLAAAAVMFLIIINFLNWPLWILLLSAPIIYFFMLYLVGGLKAKDILILLQGERSFSND